MLSVALVEPEIPQNTGNIARLCAVTNTPLFIVGVTGFRMDERAVRRAGLDYWNQVVVTRHRDLNQLQIAQPEARLLFFSTKGKRSIWDYSFSPDDCLVFGPETRGLPEALLEENWERCLTIPMFNPKTRSLNLANSVSIGLYEALRQLHQNRQSSDCSMSGGSSPSSSR
jgi:tRNA (cytidine/uridine-2'-O-)-methyltransferase